jgi:TatD DNase family protein
MYWIDAHAHISFFNEDVICKMLEQGILKNLRFWCLAGYDASDWLKQQTLIDKFPKSFAPVFGLHPWRVIEMSESDIEADMKTLEAVLPFAKALGETGVDKFKTEDVRLVQKQIALFEQHMELNKKFQWPLVLHIVRAENEALAVLKNYTYSGVIHGFSGSYETAKRFIDLGFKISVGRGAYVQGYRQLKECVQKLNISDFLIESDAATTDDGLTEDPIAVFFKVATAVAEIKKVPMDELLSANYMNVQKVFRL